MNVENSSELSRRIGDLKREKNAVILAHYYTTPEVQAVADFLGDSLALSVRGAVGRRRHHPLRRSALHGRDRQGPLPRKEGADPLSRGGVLAGRVVRRRSLRRLPGAAPRITRSSPTSTPPSAVKALTDICCTSSNALKVVESIPADQPGDFRSRPQSGFLYPEAHRASENMVLLGRSVPRPRGVFARKTARRSNGSIRRRRSSCTPSAGPISSKWPTTWVPRRGYSNIAAGATRRSSSW